MSIAASGRVCPVVRTISSHCRSLVTRVAAVPAVMSRMGQKPSTTLEPRDFVALDTSTSLACDMLSDATDQADVSLGFLPRFAFGSARSSTPANIRWKVALLDALGHALDASY